MFDDRLLWALLGAAIAVVTAWLVARHLQSAHEEMHRTCLNMASEAARMLQTTSQLTEHKAALSDLQAVVVGLNRSVTNLVAWGRPPIASSMAWRTWALPCRKPWRCL